MHLTTCRVPATHQQQHLKKNLRAHRLKFKATYLHIGSFVTSINECNILELRYVSSEFRPFL